MICVSVYIVVYTSVMCVLYSHSDDEDLIGRRSPTLGLVHGEFGTLVACVANGFP